MKTLALGLGLFVVACVLLYAAVRETLAVLRGPRAEERTRLEPEVLDALRRTARHAQRRLGSPPTELRDLK